MVSFLSVDAPELVLSALYCAGDQPDGKPGQTFFTRFYNPTDRNITACFSSYRPLRAAWQTNLNEERGHKLDLLDAHSFQCIIGKNQILTFELEPTI